MDSHLAWSIAHDASLRTRIEAVVRKRMAEKPVTATEAETLRVIPVETIAWQVTGNPGIFGKVKAALADPIGDSVVAKAVAVGVDDVDLWLIEQELTCLRNGV
jgi:hypothetical protein